MSSRVIPPLPSTRTRAQPRFRARALAWLFVPAMGLAACGGYVTVDGYDAAYVDAPVGIEAYPRYTVGDGYVYDVNGRFYHQHQGRWVAYRHAPPEVERARVETHGRGERR